MLAMTQRFYWIGVHQKYNNVYGYWAYITFDE